MADAGVTFAAAAACFFASAAIFLKKEMKASASSGGKHVVRFVLLGPMPSRQRLTVPSETHRNRPDLNLYHSSGRTMAGGAS